MVGKLAGRRLADESFDYRTNLMDGAGPCEYERELRARMELTTIPNLSAPSWDRYDSFVLHVDAFSCC